MKLPWPEFPSAHRPEETVREILDYLCWISRAMAGVAYAARVEAPLWRHRVQEAYQALFLPPVPNHGDPYPPDVPPPRTPGVWPDIPSAGVPGMTVRHQLKVINVRAYELRQLVWVHARASEVAEWDRRLSLARGALDHGEVLPIPADARTQPSAEVLAEAQAQEDAMKEHARKRALRLQRLRAQARKTETKPKRKAAKSRGEAAGRKQAAAKRKTPTKKQAPAKKKAPAKGKATAKKKAPPKKKAPVKRKATPKKKTGAKKKPAAKKKATGRTRASK